jgi:Protein of unknown function (DUF1318)
MSDRFVRWLVAAICAIFAACAVITVNVYFPEKDVKQAYKSLDDLLLKKGEETKKPAESLPGNEAPAVEQPAGEKSGEPPAPGSGDKKEEIKPQSMLGDKVLCLSLASIAYAADSIADDLAVETASMPEVVDAYAQMEKRLPRINSLFASGAIGLNRQGLLTVREKAKLGGDEAIVNAENENRKVVITGMAKALQKINEKRQPGVKVSINELMGKAAATFAEVRREEAEPGWWIELANGRWVQK